MDNTPAPGSDPAAHPFSHAWTAGSPAADVCHCGHRRDEHAPTR